MPELSAEIKCSENIYSDLAFLGISTSQKGFSYLCQAIFFAVQNPKLLKSIKANIVPKVASIYSTKSENVERAMRHSLEAAYFKNTLKKVNDLQGFCYLSPYEKPSLTNFISVLAERHIILYNKLLLKSSAPQKHFMLKSFAPPFTPAKTRASLIFPQN